MCEASRLRSYGVLNRLQVVSTGKPPRRATSNHFFFEKKISGFGNFLSEKKWFVSINRCPPTKVFGCELASDRFCFCHSSNRAARIQKQKRSDTNSHPKTNVGGDHQISSDDLQKCATHIFGQLTHFSETKPKVVEKVGSGSEGSEKSEKVSKMGGVDIMHRKVVDF